MWYTPSAQEVANDLEEEIVVSYYDMFKVDDREVNVIHLIKQAFRQNQPICVVHTDDHHHIYTLRTTMSIDKINSEQERIADIINIELKKSYWPRAFDNNWYVTTTDDDLIEHIDYNSEVFNTITILLYYHTHVVLANTIVKNPDLSFLNLALDMLRVHHPQMVYIGFSFKPSTKMAKCVVSQLFMHVSEHFDTEQLEMNPFVST